MARSLSALLLISIIFPDVAHAQTREEKVRNDRKQVEAEGYWKYNDLDSGFEEAKRTGKPILVVLRCIPCEECVKLDEEMMHKDAALKKLMDQFVRVRIISTNGLDLSLFQYDYDQSFAVFLLNPDRTIYGRFGTRSHRTDWADDVSIQGLAKAMKAALELHKDFPEHRQSLLAKTGAKPKFSSPEKYPSLKGKYKSTINQKKDVVKSCIHCHQIGDAQRAIFRDAKRSFPEDVLFQYPHPKILGLILDPEEMATVKHVVKGSQADQSGFQGGDEILSLEGQPIFSIADVQWVLHHAPGTDTTISADVKRNGIEKKIDFVLKDGWKRKDDISWRVSSWGFRRMVTGGMKLSTVSSEEKKKLGVAENSMALKVDHVGKYGAHRTAKQAGFKVGDFVIEFGGRKDLLRETDWMVFALNEYKPHERVSVRVIRNKKRLQLKLAMKP